MLEVTPYCMKLDLIKSNPHPQIAFVEYQNNNSTELIDGDAWFAAIGSGSESTLTSWNNDGFITRVRVLMKVIPHRRPTVHQLPGGLSR